MVIRLFAVAAVVMGCAHGESRAPTRVASAQTRPRPNLAELAPSEIECDALFLHAIDLISTPEVTGADKDQVVAALRDDFVRGCRGLPRSTFNCANGAATVDDMLACDHANRRSSTSNSSVAPGGMSPPAPRSP